MTELNDRIHAVQMLRDELTINNITIGGGMDVHGVVLKQGISDVAGILGLPVKFEAGKPFNTDPEKTINRYYITVGDCDISEYRYEDIIPETWKMPEEWEEPEQEHRETFEEACDNVR